MIQWWRIAPFLVLLFAFDASATSLREAVEHAVNTNPRVTAAQANRRATDEVLRQAQGRFFPEVDVNADYGKQRINRPRGLGPNVNNVWRYRRQATISVRQALFDGFDRAYDYYRSQARITAASHRVLARSEAVGLSVVEAYVDVVRHRDLLRLANENVARHEQLMALIQERFEGGKAPIGDVEQTRERLEAAKSLVGQIKIALESSKAKYRNAVGEDPVRLHKVGYAPGVPPQIDEVIAIAAQNNPRVRAAEADIDIADFDKKQFRSSLFPQITLEGSHTRGKEIEGTPDRNDEYEGKIVLTWKLFDGGVRRARERELSERYAESIAEQHILLRELKQQIEIAWARFTTGREQLGALRRQAEQNRKVVAAYREAYNANRRSLLDVLDAESAGFGSQFELSNVSALHLFSSYELLAHMGVLLERLGVSPPPGADLFLDAGTPEVFSAPAFTNFEIPPLRSQ